jgi:peptidoglycan/LPS O-acetylase OafA/YrhL
MAETRTPSSEEAGTDGPPHALRAYEPGLDGIRAIAISGVLLFHSAGLSSLGGWFRGGAVGVSIFFTLSGFLITSILLRDINEHGSVRLAGFWGRRIRRLAPAQLVTVLACVGAAEAGWIQLYRGDAIAAVWSATNWRIITADPTVWLVSALGPLGQTWSLAVEEQFYVVVALMAFVAARTRQPVRNLTIVFAAVAVAAFVLANQVVDWFPHLEFGTEVRAGELAIGCLLAVAVRRWRPLLEGRSRLLDLAGVVAIAVLIWLLLTADWEPPWLLRGGFAVVSVATSVAILAVLAHGMVSRVLGFAPFVWIGKLSYSLYLVHWPAMLAISAERFGVERWSLVALQLAIVFVLSIILHVCVENPIRARNDVSDGVTVIVWLAASVAVSAIAFTFALS